MFGNNKGKIPKENLAKLKAAVSEAKPHLDRLAAALAIVREETYALMPALYTNYRLGASATSLDAFTQGGQACFLDTELLRPMIFKLREFFELQDLLESRSARESTIPRQTLKKATNGNGRHAAKG